ncbi:hypothetical protein [Parabacteroides provencensis]|uniref:hypothetical protein n=1 Tax=Parabacteroides provencensis TaxID=1944636 RepID=UPI000C15DA0B|nr:hypothetical protein [Parabacteroides provencensis]
MSSEDLKLRAIQIRDEVMEGRNTATRVGQLLLDMIENTGTDTDILDQRYLRKYINDEGAGFYNWKAGWMTQAPVRSAEYNIGWEVENPTGWYVSETGNAWYTSMNVRGPILSNNVIGSPHYAGGWDGFGSQWSMSRGYLETDYGSFRKELRAKMFVIDQIRGTNGSLAVADCNKIDHVEDMGTFWRCYIDTYGGDVWMNFRVDDCVKCQRVTKYYLAAITNVSATYFDLSKKNLEGTGIPEEGDELIRWDNLSDPNRKGLVYLTSSDSYNPYMDVRYGDWDATQGVIKVRNGRLDGISDPAFPELYGAVNNFGLYTCNFYGTGELILRSTGESVSRTFEVLRDQINMGLSDIRYEIQVSKDSVLANPAFQDGINSWEVTNVFYPWTINGTLLQASNRPFINFVSGAVLVNDPVNNRTVLQVSDSAVTQRNAMFTDRTPGKYVLSFYYRSLLSFGSLEIGIPGTSFHITQPLSEDTTWKRAELSGDWDGMGDFIIRVSGAVNIIDISFTSDRLTNAINRVKVEYDTKLSVKADKAELNSFRDEYDEFNRVVRRDYATQSWTATKINTEVGTIVDGKLTNYATTSWTSSQINSSVEDLVSKTEFKQTSNSLLLLIDNSMSITNAFYKFDDSRMSLNRRIELGIGDGAVGYFTCQGGIAPKSDVVFAWAGSTFENWRNAPIALLYGGDGWLAKKNIQWDTNGNVNVRGKFESSVFGYRCIIDPASLNKFVMYNNDGYRSFRIFFDSYDGGIYNSLEFAAPSSNVKLGNAGLNMSINGGSYIITRSAKTPGRIGMYASWPSYDEAGIGEAYKDGSGYLKVKQ